MCGSYTLTQMGLIEDRFKVDPAQVARFERLFNIAPSEDAPVVVKKAGVRSLEAMGFGLIPAWSKTGRLDMSTINARSEFVDEKPAFREGFRRRRCLVPADGYFEWKPVGKKKVPHRITMKDGGLFAFAGIWDEWKNAEGAARRTFSIITTAPNDLSPDFLDRMPAILSPGDEEPWLAGDQDARSVKALLKPFPTEKMKILPVSTAVNNARNKGAECIAPPQPEHDLFS